MKLSMPTSINEVKSFTPIDLPLLRRIAARGISLNVVASLDNANPLETALLHVVGLKVRGRPTFILRNEEGEYAAQMRQDKECARVILLAPHPSADYSLHPWLALIDAMVKQAGKRGAHLITAEVPTDTASFELFRQAHFTVYSREILYCLEQPQSMEITSPAQLLVRPIEEEDDARLYALYASTVPQLAQQVIPPPQDGWQGLAVIYNHRLAGCLAITSRKNGLLIEPYFHPELYDLVACVLNQGLAMLPPQKIYIRLRAYQEWIRNTLELDFGFKEVGRYALMARHTVVKRESRSLSPLAALESAFSPNIEVAYEISPTKKPSNVKKLIQNETTNH
jgi:hypothetical protein